MVLVFPPSVTSSHFLLQLKLPRETKRSFYFSGCMLSVLASRSSCSCLFSWFFFFHNLLFFFVFLFFAGWSSLIAGSTSVATREDSTF